MQQYCSLTLHSIRTDPQNSQQQKYANFKIHDPTANNKKKWNSVKVFEKDKHKARLQVSIDLSTNVIDFLCHNTIMESQGVNQNKLFIWLEQVS